jgi:hypothetical protein
MTTTTATPGAPRWDVPIVQVSSGGDRSETVVTIQAADLRSAWHAAQELPGVPAESDTCHYATPVRVRGDR